MSCGLNNHERGYNLSNVNIFATALTLSGCVYAKRHWELSNRAGTCRWGHRIIAVLEAIPVIGGLGALIERVAAYIYTKFHETAQHTSDKQNTKEMDEGPKITKHVFDKKKAELAAPLFIAVEKGDLSDLKNSLMTKKLSVNSFNTEGLPLLVYAVQLQKDEIIQHLLNQPDININISRFKLGFDVGYTALHEAAAEGDVKTIQLLLQKKAKSNIIDTDGRAPIHYAIHNRHLEAVKTLIADPDVDIQLKDTQEGGYSPFLFAVERKCVDIVKELISTKKEELFFEDKDFYGNNIFHLLFLGSRLILIMKDGIDLLKLVIEACPQSSKKQLLKEKGQNNQTPYELGVQALKDYLDERENKLSIPQQKKYDEMSELIEGLNPIK